MTANAQLKVYAKVRRRMLPYAHAVYPSIGIHCSCPYRHSGQGRSKKWYMVGQNKEVVQVKWRVAFIAYRGHHFMHIQLRDSAARKGGLAIPPSDSQQLYDGQSGATNVLQDIWILTADRNQERDKNCVVIPMIRSNQWQIGVYLETCSRLATVDSIKLLFLVLMDERAGYRRRLSGADDTHPAFCSAISGIRSPAKRRKYNRPRLSISEPPFEETEKPPGSEEI
ncbi:uncharacterized protein EDB91DRAFT_1163472 [Suillus paluster]|uniref:uncharacterized protein n=1 Tax=Suillus paluster TaxID=48578 RepID=UPI001B8718BE|nr:uncharacterized protein EDB91DRAFT_1163472 [Suillus paluster]KAG1727680.1 hypothetical protein EDB91DRAFT_1163472 [Suillus paluster]